MFKNHVDLIGFIGSDPKTRHLENGTQLTSLSLATKTSWKNNAGTYDSRTEWHRIVVWGKLAQFASTLSKGAHIEVEGQLRHRTYQKQVQAGKKTVRGGRDGGRDPRQRDLQARPQRLVREARRRGCIRSGARIGRCFKPSSESQCSEESRISGPSDGVAPFKK